MLLYLTLALIYSLSFFLVLAFPWPDFPHSFVWEISYFFQVTPEAKDCLVCFPLGNTYRSICSWITLSHHDIVNCLNWWVSLYFDSSRFLLDYITHHAALDWKTMEYRKQCKTNRVILSDAVPPMTCPCWRMIDKTRSEFNINKNLATFLLKSVTILEYIVNML